MLNGVAVCMKRECIFCSVGTTGKSREDPIFDLPCLCYTAHAVLLPTCEQSRVFVFDTFLYAGPHAMFLLDKSMLLH